MVLQSSYQKNYPPKHDEYAPSYAANLTQRYNRRDAEFRHSVDAFEWPLAVWEAESESSWNTKPANVPVHKYKHDVLTQAYKDKILRESFSQQQLILSIPSTPSGERPCRDKKSEQIPVEEGPPTPPPTPQNNSKRPSQENPKIQSSQRPKTQARSAVKRPQLSPPKSERPKKPGQDAGRLQAALKITRPQTAWKSEKTQDDTPKPPFFMFAMQDKEPEVAVKKTYNVRSPVDVHASALNALKLRQESSLTSRRPKSADPKPARKSLSAVVITDDDPWATEYRKHFHGFQKEVYEKVLSARQAITRPQSRNCTSF